MDERELSRRDRVLRPFLVGAGMLSLGIALVGIVLPLIPATPFVLLAALCFARASPRFHTWLREHRLFGPSLRSWEDHRAVPRRAKWVGIAMIWISIPATLVLAPLPTWAQASLVALLLVATALLVRLPVLPEASQQGAS